MRIVRERHAATPLGAVALPSRFSDPDRQYPVLYLAIDLRTAFLETVIRDDLVNRDRRTLALAEISDRRVITIASAEPLRLLDLREGGASAVGAPTAVIGDRRHAAGQALSGALYRGLEEADGILYPSRFTNAPCAAVFDRAVDRLRVRSVESLMEQLPVLDAIEEFDIVLVES